jgi:hypothetical protein
MRSIGVLITIVAAGAAFTSSSAQAATGCGVANSKKVASSGPLVVITADHNDPTGGPYRDVEACIGSRPPYQLDVLTTDGENCPLRTVRLSSHRYVGIDIRCVDTTIGTTDDTLRSFDVLRRKGLYGADKNGDAPGLEGVRKGFVMTTTGAFAWIQDFDTHSDVIACDRRSPCNDGLGNPSKGLDQKRHAKTLGGLRSSGKTVSWRDGSKRRSAKLH